MASGTDSNLIFDRTRAIDVINKSLATVPADYAPPDDYFLALSKTRGIRLTPELIRSYMMFASLITPISQGDTVYKASAAALLNPDTRKFFRIRKLAHLRGKELEAFGQLYKGFHAAYFAQGRHMHWVDIAKYIKENWQYSTTKFMDSLRTYDQFLTEFTARPGFGKKLANMLLTNLLRHKLMHIEDEHNIELPVDSNTLRIMIATGVVKNIKSPAAVYVTEDSQKHRKRLVPGKYKPVFFAYKDPLINFIRENTQEVMIEMGISAVDLHPAIYYVGSNMCTGNKHRFGGRHCELTDICDMVSPIQGFIKFKGAYVITEEQMNERRKSTRLEDFFKTA